MDPFPGRGSSVPKEPYFDSDLYTIHTLILTSTIHLHFDNMSLKISNAANDLLGLINFLNPGDYCYLDPILAVRIYSSYLLFISKLVADTSFFFSIMQTCWYSVIVSFRRMMNVTTTSDRGDTMVPYANAFLRQGVDNLLIALRSISRYVPLAG